MSKESEDKIGEIEDRIAQRPREWWIDSDCDGYGIWRGPELGEMEGAVHVIEHSAYEKVCAELAHLKYNAMADENAFRQELDTLRASNESLRNQMLDGAEKEYLLDRKCNELRAQLAAVTKERDENDRLAREYEAQIADLVAQTKAAIARAEVAEKLVEELQRGNRERKITNESFEAGEMQLELSSVRKELAEALELVEKCREENMRQVNWNIDKANELRDVKSLADKLAAALSLHIEHSEDCFDQNEHFSATEDCECGAISARFALAAYAKSKEGNK